MPSFNVIHLAYAVMVIGILFCFVLSKRQTKDMRKLSNAFAIPFVKLSNYICPTTLGVELAVEDLGDGKVRALPLDAQPEALRFVIKRANGDKSVRLFAQLTEAADKVTRAAGINRTRKAQFSDPINRILYMTHTFLVGCEDLGRIDTVEKKRDFDSFTHEQVRHRMDLLRQISGDLSDEYRQLNQAYAKEMEAQEQQELEARRARGRKQG